MSNEMTLKVHEALAKLKVLNKRIRDKMETDFYVKALPRVVEAVDGKAIDVWKRDKQSDYQSLRDLITERDAIHRAVLLSNATTQVSLSIGTYSIAELIWMKGYSIPELEWHLQLLKRKYDMELTALQQHSGAALVQKATEFAERNCNTRKEETKSDTLKDVFDNMFNTYKMKNEYVMHDSIGIETEIKSMEDFISKFKAEVDAAISISNATTDIKVVF